MATGAAGNGHMRGVFDGCLSGGDPTVKRRPYHKNCKCALHNNSRGGGACTRHQSGHGHGQVSYPIRRSWSEGSLALMAHAPQPSGSSSPCCSAVSPAVAEIKRTQTQLVLCREEDEEEREMRGVSVSDLGLNWEFDFDFNH